MDCELGEPSRSSHPHLGSGAEPVSAFGRSFEGGLSVTVEGSVPDVGVGAGAGVPLHPSAQAKASNVSLNICFSSLWSFFDSISGGALLDVFLFILSGRKLWVLGRGGGYDIRQLSWQALSYLRTHQHTQTLPNR